jgi:hypothetical protein
LRNGVITIYVRHPVKEYAHWRRSFDAHEITRHRYGLRVLKVQRNIDHPLEIIIVLEAEDLALAREFAESNELRMAMIGAGVVGRPEVWFAEDA